jgi:DNA-directed RNA polymerase subunit M/transcription elongation factor TFIIS
MSSPDIPVVFLGQKGDIKQGKLKAATPAAMMAAFKKKELPSLLGKYVWKQKTLFLFGYVDGKDSTENQHHLPEPLEGITYYGDILVMASADPTSYTEPIPLKTAEYETIYTSLLEGDDEEEDGDDEEEVQDIPVAEEEDGEEGEGGEGADEDESYNDAGDDENDDEFAAPPMEKPTRVTKSRKSAAVVHVEEEEVSLTSTADTSKVRTHIQTVLTSLFNTRMTPEQIVEFEQVLFTTACDTAKKEEVRRAWSSTLFSDIYMATCRRIIGNLHTESYVKNTCLWERFANNELTLTQIARQNYYELCPEQWQTMLDRQAKQEQIQLNGDFSRATDKWMCNGCKMRKCTYYELQTRSADEPMTIFIQCLNCGKRWTH